MLSILLDYLITLKDSIQNIRDNGSLLEYCEKLHNDKPLHIKKILPSLKRNKLSTAIYCKYGKK